MSARVIHKINRTLQAQYQQHAASWRYRAGHLEFKIFTVKRMQRKQDAVFAAQCENHLTRCTQELLQMQSSKFVVAVLLVLGAYPSLGQGGPSDTGNSPAEESPAPDVACESFALAHAHLRAKRQ